MDYITISLSIVVIVNSALGVLVFFNSREDRTGRMYTINVLTIVAWAWSMVFYRIAGAENVMFWTRTLYVAATLIASTFLYFSYLFPRRERLTLRHTFLIFAPNICLITLVVFGSSIIDSVQIPPTGEKVIVFGNLYFLYALYILFYFTFSFYRLYKKHSRAREAVERRQILYLFLGYASSATIAFPSNLLFPWIRIFSLNWLGQVSTILMVTSATIAIFKHHLFNAKVIATELFVFALWAFIFVRTMLSETLPDQLGNATLLILTGIVGIFLIRSVLKEVSARERIEKLAKDLAKSNTDLEKANNRLKELDQLKSEFVSLATHQIRGPLTAMKGYASMLIEGDFGELPEPVKDPVEKIYQSSQSLVVIVEDFLNVSRIEQGRMKYDLTTFNLGDLVTQVVEELRPNIEKTGLGFTASIDPAQTFIVNADRGKIKQVFSNLIDNSVKYTPKGSVAVTLERKNGKIVFKIADTGVGIPKDTMPHLFQKFSRAKDANKVNTAGTGLGLYVASEMIKAHKGRIWAESAGAGKGSTFFVELAEAK